MFLHMCVYVRAAYVYNIEKRIGEERRKGKGRKGGREGSVNALPRNECNQKKIARPVLHIIYKPRWGLMSVFSGRRGN